MEAESEIQKYGNAEAQRRRGKASKGEFLCVSAPLRLCITFLLQTLAQRATREPDKRSATATDSTATGFGGGMLFTELLSVPLRGPCGKPQQRRRDAREEHLQLHSFASLRPCVNFL